MRTDARSRVGWDGKGRKRGPGPMSCVWFDVFFVIFWIVLLRFLMLSSLMSLLVSWNQSCHFFEVFLCHLKLHKFFKISWLCHLSFYVCFLRYCIMSTYVIGGPRAAFQSRFSMFDNISHLMISFSNHNRQHVPKMTHMRTYLVFGDFWSPPPHFHRFLHTKNTTAQYFSSS